METALAKASLTRVERRDPYKTAHAMKRRELQALTPAFRWDAYLKALGQPGLDDFNVTEPKFFQEMEKQVCQRAAWTTSRPTSASTSRDAARPISPPPSCGRDFDFYDAYLRGRQGASRRAGSAASPGSTATWARRWARSSCARPSRPRSRPTRERMVRQIRDGHGDADRAVALDERRDQEAGAGQAPRHARQDRLSGPLARLLGARGAARRLRGQRRAGASPSSRAASSPRSASRSTAASGG